MVGFFEIAGYLANPSRQVLIEAEMPSRSLPSFQTQYAIATNGLLLPPVGSAPFYVQENKRGIERRVYYVDNGNAPIELIAKVYNNTRPGYTTLFNRRCDQGRDLVMGLFEHGFFLGSPQDEARIRATIPGRELADFNKGYAR